MNSRLPDLIAMAETALQPSGRSDGLAALVRLLNAEDIARSPDAALYLAGLLNALRLVESTDRVLDLFDGDPRAENMRGVLALNRGDPPTARRVLAAAREEVAAQDTELWARISANLAVATFQIGDDAAAGALAEQVLRATSEAAVRQRAETVLCGVLEVLAQRAYGQFGQTRVRPDPAAAQAAIDVLETVAQRLGALAGAADPRTANVRGMLARVMRPKSVPRTITTGRRVLVGEDEALIRLDLVEMLHEEGYDVVGQAGDGETAVRLAEELRPDLCILDIKLPIMDGLTAAERIAGAKVAPVIILTAYTQRDLVERARAVGAMAYLVKPFQKTDLVPAIEVAMSRFAELAALESEVAALTDRLETRKAVERAKGVLMAHYAMTEPEAFKWIQRTALDNRLSMRQVAERLIDESIHDDRR